MEVEKDGQQTEGCEELKKTGDVVVSKSDWNSIDERLHSPQLPIPLNSNAQGEFTATEKTPVLLHSCCTKNAE
jgi:hypothetical protein